jgi:hypothetical protein
VNELYAYHHHFKWWREVKVQEEQWREELRAEEESEKPPEADSENGSPQDSGPC